ncbi:nicotinamide N-methyltransferase-like [Pseudophryne corroboree]|uniref:nicotinamide N-methyltransferase-like n=1 Tax=Pseudophryne corroboree TaxID=495146 RepID=UPI0030816F07
MDSITHKFYPVHGIDSREHLETYLSNKPDMVFGEDAIKFPMECLHRAFSEGHIKGDILIDISFGSYIHHLYTASGYFKQILVLKCSEPCIMELNKWINTRTGAFDWSHIMPYIKCLEGNRWADFKSRLKGKRSAEWNASRATGGDPAATVEYTDLEELVIYCESLDALESYRNRQLLDRLKLLGVHLQAGTRYDIPQERTGFNFKDALFQFAIQPIMQTLPHRKYKNEELNEQQEPGNDQCQDKDMTLKTAITKIMKCDIDNENLTDPEVLPPADSVFSAAFLDFISKDQDDYINNFRKVVKLLKPEGHLILFGILNTTYMMVGQDKIHVFRYDEKFARKVLTDEGFVIDHCAVHKKTADSDLMDYEAFMFITAHRE